MRIHPAAALLPSILLLAACGGSGGSGNSTSYDSGSAATVSLGVRSEPGYQVQVLRIGTPAGASVPVQVHVTPDTGEPLPSSVSCWSGTVYDAAANAIPARNLVGNAGGYAVDVPLVQPLPTGTVVWVRLTLPDGGIVEDSFLLGSP